MKSTELKGEDISHQVAAEASEEGRGTDRTTHPEPREQGASSAPSPVLCQELRRPALGPPKPASARWPGQPTHGSVPRHTAGSQSPASNNHRPGTSGAGGVLTSSLGIDTWELPAIGRGSEQREICACAGFQHVLEHSRMSRCMPLCVRACILVFKFPNLPSLPRYFFYVRSAFCA